MKQYHDLITDVLKHGTRKENRTGVDTISKFNYNYVVDLDDGFPILTTKKINWKNIVIELIWFLSGSNHSDFLEQHKCYFWRPWYLKDNYNKVSSLYGPAWRFFPVHVGEEQWSASRNGCYKQAGFNDQIKYVINELKINPMSRRMVVSAWPPQESQKASLPACHFTFVLNVQNKLNKQQLCLHLTQRSADLALGVPYNLSSYSLLLHLFSRFSGIDVGLFGHSIVDAHIYTSKADGTMTEYDHTPGLLNQLTREPKRLPKLILDPAIKTLEDVIELTNPKLTTEEIMKYFILEGYDPFPEIKFKVAV